MVAKVLTMQSVERYKSLPSGRVEIPDAALPGFYLVVQPSGAKSWAVRYRFAGQTRKLTIGPYPLFDLSAARAAAREALQMAARGRDPILEKKAGIEAARAAERDTVRVVAALYVERHLKPNGKPRYATEAEALLRNHVVARWGDRRMNEITRRDAIALTDALIDAGMGVGANRVFSAVRALFNFALEREIIETTPFLRMKPPLAETSRDRVLSDDELRLVWLAADRLGYPFGPLVQLLALTGQRRDEVARMTWAEICADGSWLLPASRTKNSREHIIPLASSALAILQSLPRIVGKDGFVLTTDGSSAASNFAKNKTKLDAAMMALAREEASKTGRDPAQVHLEPWRLHDLRRTCSTGMAKAGTPIHVVEAVLNHASGTVSGIAAIYNRYAYLDEKRTALEKWAAQVGANCR